MVYIKFKNLQTMVNTFKTSNNKGGYHMFTGLKKQLELSDTLINDIVPMDNDLVKLGKIMVCINTLGVVFFGEKIFSGFG